MLLCNVRVTVDDLVSTAIDWRQVIDDIIAVSYALFQSVNFPTLHLLSA
jgi:hypothetical protein